MDCGDEGKKEIVAQMTEYKRNGNACFERKVWGCVLILV
jgi:hypothetical protein